MKNLSLQMWQPYRNTLIAEHLFYIAQARIRLLSQFDNISQEADRAAQEHLERLSASFHPDVHDEGEVFESANDKGTEFYQLLSDMRENTRLSVIAGMFHQWEKKLKDWLLLEMSHWRIGENVKISIWRQEFAEVVCLLESFGFEIRSLPLHNRLDAMRLVVNVFKHGDGKSFSDLTVMYPEFLSDPLRLGNLNLASGYLNYTNMRVTDDHLDSFSDAILAFWRAIPEHIQLTSGAAVPKWFEKAFNKDVGSL